ncbi:hypothetical protein [Rhizobium leguminosarum]|uniref:hypothetical protein n=1 Tax=Rhizobium leguminosarum TaxID=384 RepID=UPI00143FA58A|nr:hypothetical protein [Rhizobium leguminosarum]NKL21124.1 hypothetical protein [Rhizobium leguminosarum bv. viciae]NKL56832.1 hypothetical protein [Rhizobium leguminosarum bv. viciae]
MIKLIYGGVGMRMPDFKRMLRSARPFSVAQQWTKMSEMGRFLIYVSSTGTSDERNIWAFAVSETKSRTL